MSGSVGIIGCGWLGQALAARLRESGTRVVGTTGSRAGADRLEALGVDAVVVRFDPEAEGEVSRLQGCDAIVVAIPPGRSVDPVRQARSISRVAEEAGARHVIHVSTTSVYPNPMGQVSEDDAIDEHPLRGVEKALQGVGDVATVLRCAGLYGPGRLILPYVLRAGVAVDGNAPVNLVEQSDVVRAIVRVMEEPVADVFNVCADEHPTKERFYREVARRARLEVPRFESKGEAWKVVDNGRFKAWYGFAYAFPDPLEFPV